MFQDTDIAKIADCPLDLGDEVQLGEVLKQPGFDAARCGDALANEAPPVVRSSNSASLRQSTDSAVTSPTQ